MTGAAPGAPLTRTRFRVAMVDTDAAQVIYFGAPTAWAERMITTWLADAGMPTSGMLAAGFGLPAVHVDLRYRSPLGMDDIVDGSLWLHRRSERSLTWRVEFAGPSDPRPAVVVLVTQVYIRRGIDVTSDAVAVPLPALLAALPTYPAGRSGAGEPTTSKEAIA